MSCCHEQTESKGVRKIYHLVKLIIQLDLKLLLLFKVGGCGFESGTEAETTINSFLSLSLYTAWRSLLSIIDRCTLYTPGCRMKVYK